MDVQNLRFLFPNQLWFIEHDHPELQQFLDPEFDGGFGGISINQQHGNPKRKAAEDEKTPSKQSKSKKEQSLGQSDSDSTTSRSLSPAQNNVASVLASIFRKPEQDDAVQKAHKHLQRCVQQLTETRKLLENPITADVAQVGIEHAEAMLL